MPPGCLQSPETGAQSIMLVSESEKAVQAKEGKHVVWQAQRLRAIHEL